MFRKNQKTTKIAFFFLLSWSLIVLTSLTWNIISLLKIQEKLAGIEGESSFQRDVLFRRWNAENGPIYAPITEKLKPNIWLLHPKQDIVTKTDEILTMINPSYMVRMVYDSLKKDNSNHDIGGKMLALNPIRPENKANKLEAKAIKSFENGRTNYTDIIFRNNRKYVRVINPLYKENNCIKCHINMPTEADLVGAISIAVPVDKFSHVFLFQFRVIAIGHLLIYLFGLYGIKLGFSKIKHNTFKIQESEKKFKESSIFLTKVIESIPYPFYVINSKNYEIIIANSSASKHKCVIGSHCHEISHMSSTPCSGTSHVCPLEKIKKNKKPVTVLHNHFDENQNIINVEVYAFPILNEKNELVQIIEYSIDITEKKKMELKLLEQLKKLKKTEKEKKEFLNSILENTYEMITTINLNGFITSVNKGGEYLLNLKSNQILGKQINDFLVKDKIDVILSKMTDQVPNLQIETEFIRENKSKIPVEICLSKLNDPEGSFYGFILICKSIAEKVQFQKSLIQSNKIAAVGKLAASIAHEINNPLTGILTFIEDLRDNTSSKDPVFEDYQIIYDETIRCRTIVKELLDFSREKASFKAKENIVSVINTIIKTITHRVEFQNIKFDITCGKNHQVYIDKNQIKQVFLNLIINAKDAMINNSGIIKITCEEKIKNFVKISIQDNGVGIDSEIIDRVFDPFFSTKAKNDQGSGLGLGIVANILESHGGFIDVVSEIGVGTKFDILIPLYKES